MGARAEGLRVRIEGYGHTTYDWYCGHGLQCIYFNLARVIKQRTTVIPISLKNSSFVSTYFPTSIAFPVRPRQRYAKPATPH